MRVQKSVIEYIVFGLLLAVTLYFLFGTVADVSYRFVVIENPDPNSMFPAYQQGDIFIIKKLAAGDYQVGDVIVYQQFHNAKKLVIHRIVDISYRDSTYYFIMKGDNPENNSTPDPFGEKGNLINANQLLGKTVARIPYIGHYSLAIQQNTAFQLIIVAIGLVFAVSVFRSKEKKKEYYELSKATLQQLKITLLKFVKTSKGKSSIGIMALLLLIILVQLFVPGVFYQGEHHSTGLIDYQIGNPYLLQVDFADTDPIIFYQVRVTLFDAGYIKRISGFTLDVAEEQKIVSQMKWEMFGSIVGKFSVGGTIVLHSTDFDFSTMHSLTVTLTVNFTVGTSEVATTTLLFTGT